MKVIISLVKEEKHSSLFLCLDIQTVIYYFATMVIYSRCMMVEVKKSHITYQLVFSTIEIAFYIDKKGRRARNDWIINWEGHPTAFAFEYPYILAFDSSFIEIRHIDTVRCSFYYTWLCNCFD